MLKGNRRRPKGRDSRRPKGAQRGQGTQRGHRLSSLRWGPKEVTVWTQSRPSDNENHTKIVLGSPGLDSPHTRLPGTPKSDPRAPQERPKSVPGAPCKEIYAQIKFPIALHCIACIFHRIALHYFALHRTTSHHIALIALSIA